VSPGGSDDNPGTLDRPWKTIAYALGISSTLSPGDLLYLRGGTYYEHEIYTRLKGEASAPITIQSYPGERAIIDGGVPYFKDAPNSEWEPVNSSLQLYRSRRTFEGTFVGAWLVDDDVQLVEYEASQNLEATHYGPVNGRSPLYLGPGLQLRTDGHIYIRLQYNPSDLTDASGRSIAPTPRDADPNRNRIAVFTSEHILLLDEAAYLNFIDLEFSNSRRMMDVRPGSHHILLDGCRLNYGTYGLVIRDGVRDLEIRNSEFNNGLPDYVYWTDVKNGPQETAEAYPEFQSAGIIGSLPGFHIHDNLFRDAFDALDIADGARNTLIERNYFIRLRDDAIEIPTDASRIEVAYNLLWRVGAGISTVGSNAEAGPVYIHHNVIDNSIYQRGGRSGNFREEDWPVWTTIDPFSSHDSRNQRAGWKLYNNTILTRRSGYDWDAAGPSPVAGNLEKFVYNNIFYVLDDRVVYRDDLEASGSHYDGNVIYRNAPGEFPLFYHFGDGGDYDSLADFRKNSGTQWEIRGLEIDPGFDLSVIDDSNFDPATLWERYRPTNNQVFTPGAPYLGLDWPGTEGINYRGAIPPESLP